ncbi:MAG: ABZJ_00895 family protein [Litoreibacter sp.]|uniref:ABZJ_00895 family protein n=1 Tax=Litoreibacter sp. TaxID=1969459 RepID=UPI003297590F
MDKSYLIKRYAVVSLIAMIGMAVLSYLIEVFLNHDIGSVSGMIAVFIPAMDAGQTYVRRGHGKPANGFAWKMSFIFMIVNLVIGVLLTSLLFAVMGASEMLVLLIGAMENPVFMIVLAVMMLVGVLVTRLFIGLGAKNQLKLEEKLAAKKQP